jgi:hypothetical protein
VCGAPRQAGQRSSGADPILALYDSKLLQYCDRSWQKLLLVRRGRVDSIGLISGRTLPGTLLTSLLLLAVTAAVWSAFSVCLWQMPGMTPFSLR